MRSCWRKLLVGFGLILILLVGLWLYFNVKYQHMIDVELARIRAEGWPVTAAECALEPVPDEQNAATLYRQAFEIQLSGTYTGEPGRLTVWAISDNWELVQAYGEHPTPEVSQRVQNLLSDPSVARTLDTLREASRRPYCLFGLRWTLTTIFPHYADFKAAASLVSVRALAAAREQEIGQALEWCQVGLRMSEHVAAQPELIAQLVAVGMNAIILGEAQAFLDTAAVSPQDARRMENYLCQIDLEKLFTRASAAERVVYVAWVKDLASRPTQALRGLWQEAAKRWPHDPLYAVRTGTYWSPVGAPIRKRDIVQYLQVMREEIELSKQPYRQARAGYTTQYEALADIPSSQVLLSKEQARVDALAAAKRDYSIAQIALFRVVLALKAYKYAHGAYPETLAQLQQTLNWQLPQDPFSGHSFVYRRKGKGFKLYSLWSDLDDDGGEPIEEHRYEDGDIVWECHR